MMKLWLIILAALMLAAPAEADIATIYVATGADDGQIRSYGTITIIPPCNSSGICAGTCGTKAVLTNLTTNSSGAYLNGLTFNYYETWLRLDISAIPAGSTVNSVTAYAKLYKKQNAQGSALWRVALSDLFPLGTSDYKTTSYQWAAQAYSGLSDGTWVSWTCPADSLQSRLDNAETTLAVLIGSTAQIDCSPEPDGTLRYARWWAYESGDIPYIEVDYTPAAPGRKPPIGPIVEWNGNNNPLVRVIR